MTFSGGLKLTSSGLVNPLSIDPNERVTPSHHVMDPPDLQAHLHSAGTFETGVIQKNDPGP